MVFHRRIASCSIRVYLVKMDTQQPQTATNMNQRTDRIGQLIQLMTGFVAYKLYRRFSLHLQSVNGLLEQFLDFKIIDLLKRIINYLEILIEYI